MELGQPDGGGGGGGGGEKIHMIRLIRSSVMEVKVQSLDSLFAYFRFPMMNTFKLTFHVISNYYNIFLLYSIHFSYIWAEIPEINVFCLILP